MDFDGEQPRCDDCGIVMRDIDGGWECPSCRWVLAPVVRIPVPRPFVGPGIRGG